jgi:hypothetical protein
MKTGGAEMKTSSFSDLESYRDFRELNGWRNQRLVICDAPIPSLGHILFTTSVKHGWPSKGYVEFENGKRFSLAEGTIDGIRAWLFDWTDAWQAMWEAQPDAMAVKRWSDACSNLRQLLAWLELVWELSGRRKPKFWADNGRWPSPWLLAEARREIRAYLHVLGVRDLSELAAVVADVESTNVTAKAA